MNTTVQLLLAETTVMEYLFAAFLKAQDNLTSRERNIEQRNYEFSVEVMIIWTKRGQ